MKFKDLSLEININNIRLLLLIFLMPAFIFVSPIYAATTNYYFANNGSDANTPCTSLDSPCKTLGKAQAIIDSKSSGDTVNLYFNRGDIWSMDTAAVSKTSVYGLDVTSSSPVVHIDAYGSGDKPVFDGGVTDFSNVPSHNASTGPLMWNNVFRIMQDNSSVKNIKITNSYGIAISLGSNIDYGDYITIEGCEISYFGFIGISSSANYGTQNSIITKNLIHDGGNLYMNGKTPGPDWGYAITVAPVWATSRAASGNTISYNVIYNEAGEGIHGNGATVEYNIVGDTGSVGIYCNPFRQTATDHIIRYNLVMMSSEYTYRGVPKVAHDGIEIRDEGAGGDNSNATVQVYGNIVINRKTGIKFDTGQGSEPWGEVRIFNNTLIDNSTYNLYIGSYNAIAEGHGFIYNNASILYDQTGSVHALDHKEPADFSAYWTVDNNAFWTAGGSPTVKVHWRMNYVTTDPKLAGEERGSPLDWDGQSGATYYKDITFADVTPNIDSALINAGRTLGAGYETKFLTYGTDFSRLPDMPTFQLASQPNSAKWSIGAITIGGTPISGPTMSAPQGISIVRLLQ
jgi:hypothetical protein